MPQKDFSCAERSHSQICIYSTFCFNHSTLNIERGTITKCNAELLKTFSASLLMNSARLIDLINIKQITRTSFKEHIVKFGWPLHNKIV